MLFKKKTKDAPLSPSVSSSENIAPTGGRSKSLFAKQMEVPSANIDFGFQRFSAPEPSPHTSPHEEAPDTSTFSEETPPLSSPVLAEFPSEPFLQSPLPFQANPPETEELPFPPDFIPAHFSNDLPAPLHLEDPPSFEIPPEFKPDLLPEPSLSEPTELSPQDYTLPPFTVGTVPEDDFLYETPVTESGPAEEDEAIPSLEWGKDGPSTVDVWPTATEESLPPLPHPIHSLDTMQLASETMEMPPFNGPSLTGPSIDDFWVHYSPGFDETGSQPSQASPVSQASTSPPHDAAAFLDSVHHQLYPTIETPLPPAEASLPPLEETSLTDSLASFSRPEAAAPAKVEEYPHFSLDFDEPDVEQFSEPAAIPPISPVGTLTSEADPIETGFEDLKIIALQPLDEDKTLMLVSLQATYALMGQLHGEISVIKLFQYNPLADNTAAFTVSREGAIGNQALYHVQLGAWQAVLKADPQSIQLQTEL